MGLDATRFCARLVSPKVMLPESGVIVHSSSHVDQKCARRLKTHQSHEVAGSWKGLSGRLSVWNSTTGVGCVRLTDIHLVKQRQEKVIPEWMDLSISAILDFPRMQRRISFEL